MPINHLRHNLSETFRRHIILAKIQLIIKSVFHYVGQPLKTKLDRAPPFAFLLPVHPAFPARLVWNPDELMDFALNHGRLQWLKTA